MMATAVCPAPLFTIERSRGALRPGWNVRDRIESRAKVAAVARLHLHPSCPVECLDARAALVHCSEGTLRIEFSGQGELRCEDSFYCPEFGRSEPNTALAFAFDSTKKEVGFAIMPS